MADYLVQQAIASIWCTPAQDQQSNIKLAKISQYGGVYNTIAVLWRQYTLPISGVLFHCYQVGGVSPRYLGLTNPPKAGMWLAFPEVCAKEMALVDFFTVDGRQSPRFLAWYMVSEDGAMVIAIQRYDRVNVDYDHADLFLRVYRNAYYGSIRRDNAVDYVKVQGSIPQNTNDILALQNAYLTANVASHAYAFVNGCFVDAIDLINVKIGDAVEFVYDGAIYAIEDIDLKDLSTFTSTLDSKQKYLAHSLKALRTNITYEDDIDVFLVKKTPQGKFQGYYLHRAQTNGDAVRQVTHADYAISANAVNAFLNTDTGWDDVGTLTFRILLRKSGYNRPLVNETNRINELYKLSDAEIVHAMISVDANVPEWQAAHLEAASYPKIMGAAVASITPALVQDAFGYNAMSQILAPTPQFVKNISNLGVVDIPPNLQYRSTVFEFDAGGHLLGWYAHPLGSLWTVRNPTTVLVQILSGYGTRQLDERYGQNVTAVDPTLDYRMYNCTIVNGLPDNLWRDVTDSGLYTLTSNSCTWHTNPTTTYTMVRSNRDFLCYDLNLPVQNGVLAFSLTSDQDRGSGLNNTIMQVQMGELDLWLNEKALVEDVDYIVNFPRIVVINKKYINNEIAVQKLTVRFCGHCKADLSRAVLGDRGYVSYGVLSNNNRFDLRDDKVLHIAVGGGVYDKTELTFAEDHSGVMVSGVPNGSPYVIRDIVVPMRGTTNANTYALRDAALITDQHVSDYLTLKLPTPVNDNPSPIPELYPVYSPFVSSLIDDLKNKRLTDTRMYDHYNEEDIRSICASYEPLLAFEPTRDPNKVDPYYVSVQAYYQDVVTNLDIFQYRFLARAVSLYLNNAVSLSNFVTATA